MQYQAWLTQFLELVAGGPDATVASRVLRGFLICCSLIAVVQLITMWSTQWGDRHRLSKSLLLSVLVHLCLGLGWATVIETSVVSADSEVESEPVPVRLVADDSFSEPASPRATARTTLEQMSPTVQRTPQERPNTELSQESPRQSERPKEQRVARVPTDVQRDVSPQSPTLEQPVTMTAPARTVSEIKEASLPAEARPEPTTTARTRITPTRVEPVTQTPTLTPTGPKTSPVTPLTPVPTPRTNESRPTPVPVAMSPRINRQPKVQLPEETNGTLRGVVTDVETGRPIAGTTIRFDRAQGRPLTAITREDGSYELVLPGTPDTFAITASQDGYVPDARNMRASDVAAKTGRLDFRLRTSHDKVIVLEKQPVVHHLGNDQFEGRANSRFQRQSEGAALTVAFDVASSQLKSVSNSTAVTFSAKGVQCAPNIWLNGHRLPAGAEPTPADGAYGELVFPFDRSWLQSGKNEIKIAATICNGDLDDFEFVNVQIRLSK